MPGSVENAAPSAVLPWSLSRAFVRSQEYPLIENEYAGGESQRSMLASNSRKRWRLAKRLTPAQLVTLREFYEARGGPTEPFYFYDPWETNPKFSYDPTGQATQGRYTVRFEGAWEQSAGLGLIEVTVELVELA
jgi:phage-related protein